MMVVDVCTNIMQPNIALHQRNANDLFLILVATTSVRVPTWSRSILGEVRLGSFVLADARKSGEFSGYGTALV